MNDKVNLSFYTQLIRFQGNAGEIETTFLFPNNPQQRMIQSWAHELGFAFEYSLATQSGRVVKTSPPEKLPDFDKNDLFLGFDSMTGMGSDSLWPAGCDVLLEDLNRIDTDQSFNAIDVKSASQHDISTQGFT